RQSELDPPPVQPVADETQLPPSSPHTSQEQPTNFIQPEISEIPSQTQNQSFYKALTTSKNHDSQVNTVLPAPSPPLPFSETPPLNQNKNDIFIPISHEDYSTLSKPWEWAIILKAMGKSFSREFLQKELSKLWQCGGPWSIQGAHIHVQYWVPGFKPSNASIDKSPVWMNLPELPIEFYEQSILQKVGDQIGSTIKIDANTLEGGKRRYAGVCILVKANTTPPSGAWIGKNYQPITFSEGPWYCSSCNAFGHASRACMGKKHWDPKPACDMSCPPRERGRSKERKNETKESRKRGKSVSQKWVEKPTVISGKGKEKAQPFIPTPLQKAKPGTSNSFSVLGDLEEDHENFLEGDQSTKTDILESETFNNDLHFSTGARKTPPPHLPINPDIINPPQSQLPNPEKALTILSLPSQKTHLPTLQSHGELSSPEPPKLTSKPLEPPTTTSSIQKPISMDSPRTTITPRYQHERSSILEGTPKEGNRGGNILAGGQKSDTPPQESNEGNAELTLKLVLEYILKKKDGVEDDEREILHNLGPWLDPAPMLPLRQILMMLQFVALRITAVANANALVIVEVLPPLKQMGITLKWEEASARRFQKEAELILWPHRSTWMCPETLQKTHTGQEREDNKEVLRALQRKPIFPTKMSVIFWNTRGISRPEFRRNFRLLKNSYSPDIVALAETKVGRENTETIVEDLGFDHWHLVEPVGRSGGILLLWSSRVHINIATESAQGLFGLAEVRSPPPPLKFAFAFIYASTSFTQRKILWNDIMHFSSTVTGPFICMGDFNEVVDPTEKFGGRPISRKRAQLFADAMNTSNLMDFGFHGPKFTWTNSRVGRPIHERLDRGWVNAHWTTNFPDSSLWYLPKSSSDHAPLLVRLTNRTSHPSSKPFRFEPMWFQHENFWEVVHRDWHLHDLDLPHSLDHLSQTLITWNNNSFGNIFQRKKRVLARIRGVYNALTERPSSQFHLNLEKSFQTELNEILELEETFWLSKCRQDRLALGEQNTSYFHRSVLIRRNSNRILFVTSSVGEVINDPERIHNVFLDFFTNLYTTNEVVNSYTEYTSSNSLVLSNPPSVEEIREATFSLGPHKAPGPDGFHPIFFQRMWDIVGARMCEQIQTWFHIGEIPHQISSALICLIPKQPNPDKVSLFRPISLCNTIYKIVTKILLLRLKPLLPTWISPHQNSFIKGRGPDINIVVATEILHSMHKKKGRSGWFALKIDLEKAYDRMEWAFINNCLHNLNLDGKTIKLIMSCVTSATSSILINGKKTEKITHSRGLRQGDPISPYLFNICMETLTNMINEACHRKKWSPITLGHQKVPISHLLFADDLILFGQADTQTVKTVKKVLDDFCSISGQKINENKSRLTFSPNTVNTQREKVMEVLQVRENESLGTYLGIPLSNKRPTRAKFQFLVDKIRNKLANWKTHYLSKAGRLCLISSTLSTIPSYYMQVTSIPKGTLNDIDRICNNFLWGDSGDKKKLHLISMEKTFQPKNLGGLGIRSQHKMNLAHLAKLGWKLSQEGNNLAHKCIWSKYIRNNYVVKFEKGSPIWKNIGKGWHILTSNHTWIIGEGTEISLWYDNWLGCGSLRSLIEGPLGENEEKLKLDKLLRTGEWQLEDFSFDLPPTLGTAFWTAMTFYQVTEMYLALLSLMPMVSTSPRPIGLKSNVTINIINSPSCPRCHNPVEDVTHILTQCPFTCEVWSNTPCIPLDHTEGTPNWLKRNINNKTEFRGFLWKDVFPTICHEIWKARNKFVFDISNSPSSGDVVKIALKNVCQFIQANDNHNCILNPLSNPGQFIPPPLGWSTIHTDASFVSAIQGSGTAGAIRTHRGLWVVGFQKLIYANDALMAEIRSIHEGLLCAKQQDLQNIVVYSDCRRAIDMLESTNNDMGMYTMWIRTCRHLLPPSFQEPVFTTSTGSIMQSRMLWLRNAGSRMLPMELLGCSPIPLLI
ncbi:LINE-1 retrotransposable element ORF2 protein, partial [Bienertia sinuspersici]